MDFKKEGVAYAIVFFIFLGIFLLSISVHAEITDYINLTDSTQYNETTNICNATRLNFEIIVSPCVAKDINGADIVQYVNFSWYGGQEQNTSWIFIYNESLDSGKIELWNNNTQAWNDVSDEIEPLGLLTHQNQTIGYGWQISSAIFNPNQTRETRWTFTPHNQTKKGKWSIFGKRATDTLQEAIDSDLYILMDPLWQSSFNDALSAYYNFEQASGVLEDIFDGTHNGTVSGSPIRNLGGIIGNSWWFDGSNDFANVTGASGLNVFNDLNGTVSFWFYLNTSDSGSDNKWVYTDSQASGTKFAGAGVRNNESNSAVRVGVGTQSFNPGGIIPRDEWVHTIYVLNGTDQILYVNGTRYSETLSELGTLSSDASTIGAYAESGGPYVEYFNGRIDEVAIWNRDISDSEAVDLYNNGNGVNYTTDFTPPLVTINVPLNGSYSQPINFNVSLDEPGSVLFSLDNGANNVSMSSDDGKNFNYTNESIAEGSYTFSVYANDTQNNNFNYTESTNFTVDNTNPSLIINIPTEGQQFTSLTVTLNITANDESELDTCIFNISDSNLNQEIAQTTMSNCTDYQSSVSSDGNYIAFFAINDTANNLNITNASFSVSTTGGGSGGGGGGGAVPSEPKFPVIGLNVQFASKTYLALDKEAVFGAIQRKCAEKLNQDTLTFVEIFDNCLLTDTELQEVKNTLDSLQIFIENEDLDLFFQTYKDNELFQGFETSATISQYQLIISNLGNPNPLVIIPPRLDAQPRLIFSAGDEVKLSHTFTSNKPLSSCVVSSETPDLSCEFITNSTFKAVYAIRNLNFISEIFIGTLEVASQESEGESSELRRIPISFRAINLKKLLIPGLVILVVGIIVVRRAKKLSKSSRKKKLFRFK